MSDPMDPKLVAVLDAFNAIDTEIKRLKAEVYDWRQRAEKAERELAELRSTTWHARIRR